MDRNGGYLRGILIQYVGSVVNLLNVIGGVNGWLVMEIENVLVIE